MAKSKKPMGRYALEKYLLEHQADDLASWVPEHAYRNFGWLILEGLFQYDNFAWEKIANEVFRNNKRSETHYFFTGIYTERQANQRPIIFRSEEEVKRFLLDLCTPFASYDPRYLEHQREATKKLESLGEEERLELLQGEHPDDYIEHKTLQDWKEYSFYSYFHGYLRLCHVEGRTDIRIREEAFLVFPKCVTLALEKYRWGDTYVFQTSYEFPANLPKFDPEILRAHLSESLKLWQDNLEACMQNLAPPQRKSKFERKVRKQLARLCLKQHYGLITPESMKHFKLHDPEDPIAIKAIADEHIAQNLPSFKGRIVIPEEDEYFAIRGFMLNGQKHYYMEQALWVWAWQRLLEIFNDSLETRELRDQLLTRLSPEQAQEFEMAFFENMEDKQSSATWHLVRHLNLPLVVLKEGYRLVICENPDFQPHAFLSKRANNNTILRLLFFFGRVLEEEDIQEILQTSDHLIPTYVPPLSPPEKPTSIPPPPKFPLLPAALKEDFAADFADMDADMENLFFEDNKVFIKKVLEMQDRFLKERTTLQEDFAKWCADLVDMDADTEALFFEDKKAFIKKIFEMQDQFVGEKAILEEDFAEWCADLLDEDMEDLFFEDRKAFIKKIFEMQDQFVEENLADKMGKVQKPQPIPLPNKQPTPQIPDKYSPKAIKAYLDQYVIGQESAKKSMSLVFSDHYKRINGISSLEKANAICVGPSGSGKTFLIEKATEYLDIPYCLANAASLTPTGYKGEETAQMFAILYSNAGGDIEKAQKGVVILDEIDKLGQGGSESKEWRQGVQNELLKVIERGIVSFEYGGGVAKQTLSLKTDHILFVALGHFEKLWKNHPAHHLLEQKSQAFPFSNEDLIECGMKREFLRRFCVRVLFSPVDMDMLTELFDRRLEPFQEEFEENGSALEFTRDAKHLLLKSALKEGIGMSALDQKIHEVLTPLRFDIEDFRGYKCVIERITLERGYVYKLPLDTN